jgi:peptidoglycan/LPS O-acetylase OafA/YrhL
MRPLTHADFLAMKRFPALDGLRAVAALLVVFFHFAGPKYSWLSGWTGVDVFFALSGFLITTLMLREESGKGKVSLRNFYIRRVFRIMPVYYVVLFAAAVLFWLRHAFWGVDFSEQLPYYLTFTTEFAGGHSGGWFGLSWTLGIEQKFYLVWPLLAFGAGIAFSRLRPALTLVLLPVLLALGLLVKPMWINYFVILLGCLLAVMMHSKRGFAIVRPLTHPVFGIAATALFVTSQLHVETMRDYFGGEEPPTIALYSVSVLLMLPSLLNSGPVTWLLSTKPLEFIGARSYSLYLVQFIAGIIVAGLATTFTESRLITAIATTLVALALADLLYRWVEQPMIGVGRRLTERLKRKPPIEPLTVPVPVVAVAGVLE